MVLKQWPIFFFISRLVIGCTTIAFSNLVLNGMCGCSAFCSLILSFTLFIYAPASAFSFLSAYIPNTILLNLVEGCIRITIFVAFISLVSMTEDMRRVFGYHGAEHKTVHAYEANEELSVHAVKKYSVIHPRCGTSFILVVFIMSIVVFSFLGRPDILHRVLYKLALLPLISGVSYELIRAVARLPLIVQYIFLWPGLLMQRLTTREPDDAMILAAIAALQSAKGAI